jgi:hypothetical protein
MTPLATGVKTAVTITADITNDLGVATDPSTLTFSYSKPNGDRVDILNGDSRIVRDGAAPGSGHYAIVIDCDQEGHYTGRWAATGPEVASEDILWEIPRSKLYP